MIYDPSFEGKHTHMVLLTLQKMKKEGLLGTPPLHVHTTQSPTRLRSRQECLLLHSFKYIYFFLETIL